MRWSDYLGHDRQRSWFLRAVQQNRLASTFLMVGPSGCGKRTFARLMAKSLLCPHRPIGTLDACERCESCVQVDAGTHPDLLCVSKPPGAASLSIDILAGSVENRLREGVCYELHMKPFHGLRRIAIIDDADTIHEAAANSMLKTLEEPPPMAVIFLIGSNELRQLPTIRSRSQIVRFQGLTPAEITSILAREERELDRPTVERIAHSADGSLSRARELLDEDLRRLREDIHQRLGERPMNFVSLAKGVQASLEGVGEEGEARRHRLRLAFDFAIEYYRRSLFQVYTGAPAGDRQATLEPAVSAKAIAHCVQFQSDIDRNATPAGLLEAWSTELAAICGV